MCWCSDLKMLQNEVLPELLSYRDVHYNHLSASNPDEQAAMRDAISLHLVNHVLKYVLVHVIQHRLLTSLGQTSTGHGSKQLLYHRLRHTHNTRPRIRPPLHSHPRPLPKLRFTVDGIIHETLHLLLQRHHFNNKSRPVHRRLHLTRRDDR